MSDSLTSVPPVSGPPLMFEVPPVKPVAGRPYAPQSSSSDSQVRSDTPKGVGQNLDILV
jgi:hypothetical protein